MAISSVSPGPGETVAATEALRLLRAGGLDEAYAESGLEALAGDPHGRSIAYALIRGAGDSTVVLLGHLDTVGTSDFGSLEPIALDPDALAGAFEELLAIAPEIAGFAPSDWMYGRGVADMKSGVAATLAVARELAIRNRTTPLPVSVVVVATVDEENESAGAVQSVALLQRLRRAHGLAYVGAINTDYVSARFPGDIARPLYAGTVGKLLPSFFIVGCAGHAGDPFGGLDANLVLAELIRDLCLDPELADIAEGMANAPPISLRATDLKERYDTQLAIGAHLALNLVTVTKEPGRLVEELRERSAAALQSVLDRTGRAKARWRQRAGLMTLDQQATTGTAHTFQEVRDHAAARVGEGALALALEEALATFPATYDSRRCTLGLVEVAWRLSGLRGPAVVVYLAPPYYPHLRPRPSNLLTAMEEVVAANPHLELVLEGHFPLLSDLSYLGYQEGAEIAGLIANMPLWGSGPRRYSLPLEAIRELDMPVANIGPFGFGVHQAGERVHRLYAFAEVPRLLMETIERVGAADRLT